MPPRFDLLKRHGGNAGLRDAVTKNTSLRAEVEAELAAISDVSEGRCIITAEYREALRKALA